MKQHQALKIIKRRLEMAPNTNGISFIDKNIEILLIIAAVIFSIILITTIIYTVKFWTVKSGNLLKFL